MTDGIAERFELSLQRPAPGAIPVRAARDGYLRENGFTLEGYDAPRTEAYALGIKFWVPNTPSHRRAIMLHDLHHVATGFGTSLTGEAEISSWELGSGLRGLALWVKGIVVFGTLMGLAIAPRRTLRAWRLGRGAKNLFMEPDVDAFLDLSVSELRERVGVPREGLAHVPRELHERAPSA